MIDYKLQAAYYLADNRYHKAWEHRQAILDAMEESPEKSSALAKQLADAESDYRAKTAERLLARSCYVASGAVI